MKVAVINLTGGGMSGGYRKYLKNVIPRLATHAEVDEILCASPSPLSVKEWFDDINKVRFIDCKAFSLKAVKPDSDLQEALKVFSPDVIYLPVERFFRFNNVPVVNMVRNMEPLVPTVEKESLVQRFEHWVQRMDGRRAVNNADRVIAVSRFVYDFLFTQWKIPKHKIGLVYHGVNGSEDPNIRRPNIIPGSWDKEFIFTAGSICPARGLSDLLKAMNYLSQQGKDVPRLVIAGQKGRRMDRHHRVLKDMVNKYNLSDKVCWAGNLNDYEMSWCYNNCQLFVMTSRVESFGMIAGEALAHGCVTVSTDNPCLPEIFGDTALYYKAGDSAELAETIKAVLKMENDQREDLTRRAVARSNEYSWDTCVSKTVNELLRSSKRTFY